MLVLLLDYMYWALNAHLIISQYTLQKFAGSRVWMGRSLGVTIQTITRAPFWFISPPARAFPSASSMKKRMTAVDSEVHSCEAMTCGIWFLTIGWYILGRSLLNRFRPTLIISYSFPRQISFQDDLKKRRFFFFFFRRKPWFALCRTSSPSLLSVRRLSCSANVPVVRLPQSWNGVGT